MAEEAKGEEVPAGPYVIIFSMISFHCIDRIYCLCSEVGSMQTGDYMIHVSLYRGFFACSSICWPKISVLRFIAIVFVLVANWCDLWNRFTWWVVKTSNPRASKYLWSYEVFCRFSRKNWRLPRKKRRNRVCSYFLTVVTLWIHWSQWRHVERKSTLKRSRKCPVAARQWATGRNTCFLNQEIL